MYRCFDREYINNEEFESYKHRILEIDGKIGGLISYLKKSDFKGTKYK